MNWQIIATSIADRLGKSFVIEGQHRLGGGCINDAYRIEGEGQVYFVKLNRADLLDMFVAEAEGLTELAQAGAVKVPQPVCYGSSGGEAFLVLEYLALGGGGRSGMGLLGQQLVALHRTTAQQFGWRRDNTIGATPQSNHRHADWVSFWQSERLGPQLQLAHRQGAGRRMLQKGERLLAYTADFFRDYQPLVSLLHGDLWSGNYSILTSGEPVIFDPAVYYGDRETDLAMTELFGGFGEEFYTAYNAAWPLDSGYRQRKTFYNLYHILNHFNMFGGGYGTQAEGMMDRLLSELN